MFTYREEYYLENRDPSNKISGNINEKIQDNYKRRLERAHNKAEIIIGKNRHGRTETIHTAFFGEYSLFDNLDEAAARAAADFIPFEDNQPISSAPDTDVQDIDVNAIPDDIPV